MTASIITALAALITGLAGFITAGVAIWKLRTQRENVRDQISSKASKAALDGYANLVSDLQDEVTFLQAQVALMRKELQDCESEKRALRKALRG